MKQRVLHLLLPVLIGAMSLCTPGYGLAAVNGSGSILPDKEAGAADTATLASEASVFGAIRLGIALSMAQCEGAADCTPAVKEEELKQLIKTLDARIDDLTSRQEDAEDPEEFAKVLAAYNNERDEYANFMEKLGTLSKDVKAVGEEPGGEEELPPEGGADEGMVEKAPAAKTPDVANELQFFEDPGSDLQDDEQIQDDENPDSDTNTDTQTDQ